MLDMKKKVILRDLGVRGRSCPKVIYYRSVLIVFHHWKAKVRTEYELTRGCLWPVLAGFRYVSQVSTPMSTFLSQ